LGLSLISYHKPKILGQICMMVIKINKEQSIPEVKILQYQNNQHDQKQIKENQGSRGDHKAL